MPCFFTQFNIVTCEGTRKFKSKEIFKTRNTLLTERKLTPLQLISNNAI